MDYYLPVGIKNNTVLEYKQFYIILKQLGFLTVKVLVHQILPIGTCNTFFLRRTTDELLTEYYVWALKTENKKISVTERKH